MTRWFRSRADTGMATDIIWDAAAGAIIMDGAGAADIITADAIVTDIIDSRTSPSVAFGDPLPHRKQTSVIWTVAPKGAACPASSGASQLSPISTAIRIRSE